MRSDIWAAMSFGAENYRHYLKTVLSERVKKNPSYSLRAFATALGLSSGGLSRILKGEKNLSLERASQIASKLNLSSAEAEYFVLLVQANNAKTPELRETFLERLNSVRPGGKIFDLSVDHFKVISDWYHLAILEALDVVGLEFEPKAIAKFLGITPIEAELAIERLVRLELIEFKAGKAKPVRTVNRLLVESNVPKDAMRKYYRQTLQKALESVDAQTPDEKVIGTEVFAFDSNQLEEARKISHRYLDEMLALSKKSKNKRALYQVCAQFFRLNEEKHK